MAAGTMGAGAVATFILAGAWFRYDLLWVVVAILPLFVIFVDSATGEEWTTRSTMTSKETRDIEGIEVPVVRLEISSVSHPFWTGKMRELDSDGKIERFRKRYGGGK